MLYGITGNTDKDAVWKPATDLVSWLRSRRLRCLLDANVAEGLARRGLAPAVDVPTCKAEGLAAQSDVILSFGGDGTMLRTARLVGTAGTPVLGVNVGRLGFLADVETGELRRAINNLESGAYTVDERLVLAVSVDGKGPSWALNDVVVARAGPAGLVALDVTVGGALLNRYWSDGLIVATPTGSTGYSLAVGGPIMIPGSSVLLLSPIAPHSLTIRPVVVPSDSEIEIRVSGGHAPYIIATDGLSTRPRSDSVPIRIRRAAHTIRLVKFAEQPYFQTLRSKLSWGVGPQAGVTYEEDAKHTQESTR